MLLLGDPGDRQDEGKIVLHPGQADSHDVYDTPTTQRRHCNVDPPECPEDIEKPAPSKTVFPVQHCRRYADERDRSHRERAKVETLHWMSEHGVPYTRGTPITRHVRDAEDREEY